MVSFVIQREGFRNDYIIIVYAVLRKFRNLNPFNLGRTATHEVGRWFNLNHICGEDGTGCSGTEDVDDTPNQGGPITDVRDFQNKV